MINSKSLAPENPRTGFLTLPTFRDILVIALILVAAWKLFNADIKIEISAFSFSDFLALVLALFSVALSIAFYFKATDASNQFYDNTYRFTKEMSEILGRIEAGFGERLRHLDEGYSGVRDRLDKLPSYNGATHSDVKKEEEEIKRKESEQKATIEDLAQKAKLAEHEKQALFDRLARQSDELEKARSELRHMQESRRSSESELPSRRSVLRYIAKTIRDAASPEELAQPLSNSMVMQLFAKAKPLIAEAALKDMAKLDLLDHDGDLNRESAMLLRFEIRRP